MLHEVLLALSDSPGILLAKENSGIKVSKLLMSSFLHHSDDSITSLGTSLVSTLIVAWG